MMDVAQFRVRSGFPQVPTVLYMHENQLTYDRSRPDLARGAINWRSVESADRVVFNSQFHRDDFFGAAPQLGVTAIAADRAHGISLVLPVGIEPFFRLPARRVGGPPVVLWNHRWEADKDPDAFVEALMQSTDLELRLVLAGEGRPPARLLDSFGPRVLHAGFAPEATYRKLLQRSDIVVSTARQEFFGVSVAEAMAGGAVPLVPNRLAYPELLGPDLAACLYEPGTLAARLRSWVTDRGVIEALRPTAQQAGRRFDWRKVAPRYDVLIDEMA
jgi:glycosyltransferase involved in cell wall biosynthesis